MFSYYEFFCGGGMARAGLGSQWDCVFANDIDLDKGAVYEKNWGGGDLTIADVKTVLPSQLEKSADLLWASFPCQDLSLAGKGLGLNGERSSTISEIWRLVDSLRREGRAPSVIAFENVPGLITSRGGRDFEALTKSFCKAGYRVGSLLVDAAHFLPQSRKRVFIVGVRGDLAVPEGIVGHGPTTFGYSESLTRAIDSLPPKLMENWIWWNVETPVSHSRRLIDVLEETDDWHLPERTAKLLSQMSERNFRKLETASKNGLRTVGTVFRRTRVENGLRRVRAEVRFDGLAGCLRTPNGGSSKQILIEVIGDNVRTRHLTGRECARLMGLSDSYQIPDNHNKALYLTGDGVAVPVVSYLRDMLFEPILELNELHSVTDADMRDAA
ncbi:MAG: DNA cytosine methyltransferase [Litorimonas sp.]